MYENNGTDLLANAIVEQAISDYANALCKHHNASNEEKRKYHQEQIDELEEFFTGEDIKILTASDGPKLMALVKRLVRDNGFDIKKIMKSRVTKQHSEKVGA